MNDHERREELEREVRHALKLIKQEEEEEGARIKQEEMARVKYREEHATAENGIAASITRCACGHQTMTSIAVRQRCWHCFAPEQYTPLPLPISPILIGELPNTLTDDPADEHYVISWDTDLNSYVLRHIAEPYKGT